MFGIYAPGGTSAPIVRLLHDEVNKALANPKVVRGDPGHRRRGDGVERNEFIERQQKDRERYGAFIKEIGLKVE